MKRFAFKMYLKPGMEEEYKKRHAQLWPEMKAMLEEKGVHNYSIYWDKDTNILFGYQEVHGEASSQDGDIPEINRKWWDFMAPLMEVDDDNSPVTIDLPEMFHLD